MTEHYDIAIIGSGPGGYVAAIKAAQSGKKVVCIEKSEIGGICLNWGCIPTKALIKNSDMWREFQSVRKYGFSIDNASFDYEKIVNRSRTVAQRLSKGVEFLFKKNNITNIKGFAEFKNENTLNIFDQSHNILQTISADSIIIATGARPKSIPGIKIDKTKIISSKEALVLNEVPESIIILGAGAIGIEFAYIFRSFGADVTIVEMMDQIVPNEDEEIAKELTRSFKKQKIKMLTGTKVKTINNDDDHVSVVVGKNGEQETIKAQYVLMAIGVQPNIENINLGEIGIKTENNRIKVDENYQTNIPGIYAIGDVIGAPCLAHVASEEGILAVRHILGQETHHLNYNAVPGCTYCQPQIASVGFTQKQAEEKGINIKVGHCHFRANGKSMATGEIDGFVKVIFNRDTKKIIGAHIIGNEATELITELTLAISNHMTYKEITSSIHAHPSLSEAVMEAIMNAFDEAIHL